MDHPVTFEPLPAEQRPRGKSLAIAAQLKARPGEWAHVTTCSTPGSASSYARQINAALLAQYAPAGSYEAVSRTVDGERRVYARYVGPTA